MTPIEKKGARFGLALLGAAALFASTAASAVQPAYGGGAESPGDALSRNLKLIADSPHNVGAMVGAGKAALELGDAQAALSLFARAEQDAPRDGWVKKWMGSALVQLEQPAAALKFFRDAVELGVPDASVAGDRGLAWDISGDPRRAQRDYRLALSRGSDPEVTRRLALSLAISGERQAALQVIEDQVMQRDRAALRTRALVLALTGDRAGADRAVESAMPGPQAEALEPFLARLPSLSLADRALAVHLGHFPGTGRSATPPPAYAQNAYGASGLPAGYTPTPYPASAAASRQDRSLLDAGRPDDSRPRFGRSVASAAPVSTQPRRIPGTQSDAARPAARSQPQSAGPSANQWSWSRGELSGPHRGKTQVASAKPAPAAPRPEPVPPRADEQADEPDDNATVERPDSRPVEVAEAETAPAVQAPPPSAPARTATHRSAGRAALSPPSQAASRTRLADVAAALDRIDEERARERAAGVPPAGTRMSGSRTHGRTPDVRTADAAPAAKPKPAKKAPPPPPRDPARHWVQVAGGANRDTLPREFAKLKEKAPKLFAGRIAWAATANATNRLLVGPFDSDDEAQDFVNRLRKADLHGFTWTSEAGQKVEKLPAK